MGADHARVLAEEVPGAVVRVVCDAAADRARAVADAVGAADVEADGVAAIARADVDAVLVASPDPTHAPLTVAAVEAGKPVLCEKPLAPTAAEGRPVLEAEAKAGRRLVSLGFMRRFDPGYRAMKAALTEGRIGPAAMLHCLHRNVAAPPGFTGPMAITNSAPHEFDIARWLLDTDVAAISAFQPRLPTADGRAGGGPVAGPVVLVLETAAGPLVTVEVNTDAAYGYDVRGELVGRDGSVELAAPTDLRLNAGLSAATPFPADWRPRFAEAYRRQDIAWVRSIESGSPADGIASAWDGWQAARVAEAGVRALAEGRRVALDAEPPPALYA
jgi:myo-inositol 2-dehydrogenase/D-chiro-inositol 1-dehydrogenase